MDQARNVDGLLFDLDDTLLDEGRLRSETLRALYDLKAAGLQLVGVTGRPCGWGQVLLRQWPVDAMLTENGIIGLYREDQRVKLLDRLLPPERIERRRELRLLVESLHRQFPELRAGNDVEGRLCDYSFDIGEFEQVPPERIAEIRSAALQSGASVIVSSIHLHVSLDAEDKATGSVRLLRHLFGVDPTTARYRYAYVGDSGNDAPCFAAFHHSIGVANLSSNLALLPRYQTPGKASIGFCQLAQHLLKARSKI